MLERVVRAPIFLHFVNDLGRLCESYWPPRTHGGPHQFIEFVYKTPQEFVEFVVYRCRSICSVWFLPPPISCLTLSVPVDPALLEDGHQKARQVSYVVGALPLSARPSVERSLDCRSLWSGLCVFLSQSQ